MSGLCQCEKCRLDRDWVQATADKILNSIVEEAQKRGDMAMYHIGEAFAHYAGAVAGHARTIQDRNDILEDLLDRLRDGCKHQVCLLRESGALPAEQGSIQ